MSPISPHAGKEGWRRIGRRPRVANITYSCTVVSNTRCVAEQSLKKSTGTEEERGYMGIIIIVIIIVCVGWDGVGWGGDGRERILSMPVIVVRHPAE